MSSADSDSDRSPRLHLDHLFKVGALVSRSSKQYPPAVRKESRIELLRYRDEGLIQQKEQPVAAKSGDHVPMTKSGFCAHPTTNNEGSHLMCKDLSCTCECHEKEQVFSGQGIIFAVIDDRERMRSGRVTTIDILTEAIEAALDAGHEDSESIARYITTSAFQHVRDRRVRFNSVLKAGDIVGAQITQKLYNTYNELAALAEESADAAEQEVMEAEARGFASALNVVMNPFSVEDRKNHTLINWDELDHLTDAFEEEQRVIREEKAEEDE
jgi:hypothetical protein